MEILIYSQEMIFFTLMLVFQVEISEIGCFLSRFISFQEMCHAKFVLNIQKRLKL
jgi:hypothetical protein